jgi:hypothetical protein
LHYWVRFGDRYSPALIVFEFILLENIFKIKCYFFRGLSVSDPDTGELVSFKSPDNELVQYCIAGFSKEYLLKKYSFSDMKAQEKESPAQISQSAVSAQRSTGYGYPQSMEILQFHQL